MLDWRAYYRGGMVCCADGTGPADLPRDNCLGVAILLDDGGVSPVTPKRLMVGSDWYWLAIVDGGAVWCEGDRAEYPTQADIEKRYPGAVVIRGHWTSDEEMRKTQQLMACVWR